MEFYRQISCCSWCRSLLYTQLLRTGTETEKERLLAKAELMKQARTISYVIVTVLLGCLLAGSVGADDTPATAGGLWRQVCAANIKTKEYSESRRELQNLISSLSQAEWVPVATALMQRGVDEATNSAALSLFGKDAIAPEAIESMLNDRNRSWPQRMLLRTCYRFIRPDYSGKLSEKNRDELVGILAKHLETLARQKTVSYGEERLMSHLIQSVLARYAGKEKTVSQMGLLSEAMHAYVIAKGANDMLAGSIAAWMKMPHAGQPAIDSESQAVLLLGHWDPLVRMKATTYLASQVRKDKSAGSRVMVLLDDPRDEVVAAAAGVFGLASSYEPDAVIKKMVVLLTAPNSRVVVQQAACETLIAHSDEAQTTVDLLLEALGQSKIKPGPNRTKSILDTLSYLIHAQSPPSQKQRLLEVAIYYLEFDPPTQTPEGPQRAEGALKALEALGSYAKPAMPNIKRYRDERADRFMKQQINRHVLPSIETP